jgi:hypothetical protein
MGGTSDLYVLIICQSKGTAIIGQLSRSNLVSQQPLFCDHMG